MSIPDKAHLLVIDPSVAEAETEGVATVVASWPGTTTVIEPALATKPGEMCGPASGRPVDFDGLGYDFDAVVLLGSAASVHDRLDWLDQLSGWLEPIIQGSTRLPLLGICFGHQLVAHAAGGEIGFLRDDESKDVGVRYSTVQASRLYPKGAELRIIVTHREQVRALPGDYRTIAARPDVAIDGFEHRRLPIFGFQFHPEARDHFAAVRAIDSCEVDDRLRSDGDRLFQRFFDLSLTDRGRGEN